MKSYFGGFAIIVSLLLLLAPARGFADEVAISFDDAPKSDDHVMTGHERTSRIIEQLKEENVQAIFFINTRTWSDKARAQVQSYVDAGHLVANHTSDHADYQKVGLKDFLKQVDQADQMIRSFSTFRPLFRYPFLNEGIDLASRDAARRALQKRGYREGYVTVDTNDWYFEKRLQEAIERGDTVDRRKLKKVYFQYLLDALAFYDDLAMRTLGRSPRHVILLHENDINALYLKELLQEIRKKGWTIISPDEAYIDALAKEEPQGLYSNNGRIAALADERGICPHCRPSWDDYARIDRVIHYAHAFKEKKGPSH